jgi:D-glycero-alpha-D-manno-heptose-7-phosphate kinase
VSYTKTEEVNGVHEIEHKLVRTVLQKLNIDGGVEITSIADIPSRGSGLGSSSSFTVGLLHALHAYQGRYRSKQDLGREACEVEIDLCCEPIGKQDQFAAAVGGINLIRFNPDDSVDIEPVIVPHGVMQTVEGELLMFYTGIVRSASDVLRRQSDEMASDKRKHATMDRMVEMAFQLRTELSAGRTDSLGEILHESWILKKSLTTGISTGLIDDCYERARAAGARGGKLLGAGGGGFLVFSAPKERHDAIKQALADLMHVNLGFDKLGSSIVFYQPSV